MAESRWHPSRETLLRFPELAQIEDEDVRTETARLIEDHAKPWFYDAPAATTYKHHNMYSCGEHGLWIHTKMAFTAYEHLHVPDLVQGRIDEEEVDLGRAAILLHDIRKFGGEAWFEGKKAAKDHALLAEDLILEESDLDTRVADAVAAHMGPFDGYAGPEPVTPLEHLVHRSDYSAATKKATYGVYKPHDDIRELYPSIPEVTF